MGRVVGGHIERPTKGYFFKLSKEEKLWLEAQHLPCLYLPSRIHDFSEFLQVAQETEAFTKSKFIEELLSGQTLCEYLSTNPLNWTEEALSIFLDKLGANGRVYTLKEIVNKYNCSMYRARSLLRNCKLELTSRLASAL